MNCPQHPIRKRPKTCAICEGNLEGGVVGSKFELDDEGGLKPIYWPEEKAPTAQHPRTTPDGMAWLDPSGNQPVLDAKGVLLEPFVFQLSNGAKERWMPGAILPTPPAVYVAWAKVLEAKRAAIHKPKGG